MGFIKTKFLTNGNAVGNATEELFICFAGAYRFVIDPIRKTVISKTSGKW